MATDEIGLNDGARGAAASHADETDLAELIIQLAGDSSLAHPRSRDPPQPRRDPRRCSGASCGAERLTDEPAALAEAARRFLREKFLSARVGVSGANFAVAETGHVVVLESEGNGRMCTTLPEMLITVMGIEKVLPRSPTSG